MICHMSCKTLKDQLLAGIRPCVLTTPTAAAFNGMHDAETQYETGFKLKFFGDGYGEEDTIYGCRVYHINAMKQRINAATKTPGVVKIIPEKGQGVV